MSPTRVLVFSAVVAAFVLGRPTVANAAVSLPTCGTGVNQAGAEVPVLATSTSTYFTSNPLQVCVSWSCQPPFPAGYIPYGGPTSGTSCAPIATPPASQINGQCEGACGIGCSSGWPAGSAPCQLAIQSYFLGPDCVQVATGYSCYSAPSCYVHDLCLDEYGTTDTDCNLAAIQAGAGTCVGQGYPGCAGPGSCTGPTCDGNNTFFPQSTTLIGTCSSIPCTDDTGNCPCINGCPDGYTCNNGTCTQVQSCITYAPECGPWINTCDGSDQDAGPCASGTCIDNQCFGGCSGSVNACGVCNGPTGGCDGCGGSANPCGVCKGPAGGCDGCGGGANPCGVCNGPTGGCDGCGGGANACGVCNGPTGGCDGCGGAANACGVCNGPTGGCDGCGGTANACGVCNGPTEGCDGCGGSANACGACDGPAGGCDGCGGSTNDCGACNGPTGGCDGCGGEANACGTCNGPTGGCDGCGGEANACGACNGPTGGCDGCGGEDLGCGCDQGSPNECDSCDGDLSCLGGGGGGGGGGDDEGPPEEDED
jgi:hypothetical protein